MSLRAPGLTVAVVLTLGLGLGVNAAMFTFLEAATVQSDRRDVRGAAVLVPGAMTRSVNATRSAD